MSIAASDLKLYKSSSGSSEGGTITSTEITGGIDNELIPDVGSAQVVYRKVFLKNTNSSDTAKNIVLYFGSPLNTNQCTIELALGAADDTIPPETWYSPQSYDTGIQIGSLAPGESQGIWIKITTVARTKSTGTGGSVDFDMEIAFTG